MTRIVVGNLLEGAEVTMTPTADPSFPAEFLSDGPGQLGARFSALDPDPQIVVDLNPIPFGDGAVEGADLGDVIGSSDPDVLFVDVETAWEVRRIGGSHAAPVGLQMIDDAAIGFFASDHGGNDRLLMLGASSGSGVAAIQFRRKAGARLKAQAWCANGGSATTGAAVRIYCATAGLWLKPDGTWSNTEQDLITDATTDHVWLGINAGAGVEFEVPSALELAADEADLEFQLVTKDDSGVSFFDDLSVVDAADFLGVFNGHNITPALAPEWESSDDGSSWTTRATFTVARHQFFEQLDEPVFARFHRFAMTGTPAEKVYLSDLVLGLGESLEREPVTSTPIVKSYREIGQQRLETPAGSRRIANRGPYPPRTFELSFRFPTAAEEAAVMALLVDKVRGGAESVVIIPANDLGAAAAVYGDLQPGAPVSHSPALALQPGDDGRREYFSDARFVVDEGAGFEIRRDGP